MSLAYFTLSGFVSDLLVFEMAGTPPRPPQEEDNNGNGGGGGGGGGADQLNPAQPPGQPQHVQPQPGQPQPGQPQPPLQVHQGPQANPQDFAAAFRLFQTMNLTGAQQPNPFPPPDAQ